MLILWSCNKRRNSQVGKDALMRINNASAAIRATAIFYLFQSEPIASVKFKRLPRNMSEALFSSIDIRSRLNPFDFLFVDNLKTPLTFVARVEKRS